MGCKPCQQKRAMIAAGIVQKFQVVHKDGTSSIVFNTLREAQRDAAANPGSSIKVIQQPVAANV